MSENWKKLLGIGKEDSWGSEAVSTEWLTYLGADSLKEDRQYVDLDGTNETRGRIAMAGGDFTTEGDIPDIEVIPDVVALLLEAAMGTVNATVYTLKEGTLPSLTIEKQVGSTVFEQYVGMKIQELTMSTRARETLKMSVSMVGKRRLLGGSATERSYSSKKPFMFYQGVFKIDDSEVKIREFEITLANTLRHPNHQSGDIYSLEQVEGVRDVTGSFLMDFANTDLRVKHTGVTSGSLELTFTNGSDSLKIECPLIIFPAWAAEEDEQIVLQRVDFRALRQDDDNREMKVTLVSA